MTCVYIPLLLIVLVIHFFGRYPSVLWRNPTICHKDNDFLRTRDQQIQKKFRHNPVFLLKKINTFAAIRVEA
ncbi:MAG TPA: hypothetical protein DEG28_04620 [Porphyromonadaceae bacterium]|nr:hypothetical protein [Porphyromonadaceae bacterium]HBX45147.1 hypothetical protein [Porphyromonadaceae bacterium]